MEKRIGINVVMILYDLMIVMVMIFRVVLETPIFLPFYQKH